jgi:cytochrome c oxidase subunit 4
MKEKEQEKHIVVSTKTFVLIWLALLLLTGVTIKAAQMRMGEWSILANLLIASTKASLVLWFFMHLKYEKMFFKLLFIVPIATITIIIGLTFFDIWYR